MLPCECRTLRPMSSNKRLGASRQKNRVRFGLFLYARLFFLTLCLGGCSLWPGESDLHGQQQVQQAPKARITYVAIGASDTYGTGTSDPDKQNWPVDLTGKLGSRIRLVNLGIPGIEVHDALNVELPVAIDAHPDLVTIWLAVDDLIGNVPVSQYSQDMDLLLSHLQATAPHALILVANVPNIVLLPRFQATDTQSLLARISSYNTAIAEVVGRHHIALVDLYQQSQVLTAHPEYISSDGLHPNARGYTQLAMIFYSTLQKYKL
ncbi:MAG TPA: SGNH/GDSL hydrolase family protein [Ktedonobacteraceae bacterium]